MRQVNLTLFFEATQPIQASHVAPLVEQWRREFPDVSERPPLWSGDGPGGMTLMPESRSWPLPFTRYENPAAGQAVSFQNDRLEVEWSFLDSHHSYPGFAVLIEVLRSQFDAFCQVVSNEADIIVSITRAQCRYENYIEGMTSPAFCVGLLTDWQGTAGEIAGSNRYLGLRFHSCPEELEHGCSSWVAVDGDEGEDATLSIIVERPTVQDSSDPFECLLEAHQELLATFVRYTSPKLQAQWGRQQ